jgi:hypothetical protein
MRQYRFFFHYNKPHKKMSVHFRGQCHIVKHVTCHAPCETKWNTTQPNIVMQGFATTVTVDPTTDTATIDHEDAGETTHR